MRTGAVTEPSGWAILWGFVQLSAWAIYAGGAFAMEAIWRRTQPSLPQSQIAVACQWMGRRYRWMAAIALGAAAAGGSGVEATAGSDPGPAGPLVWLGWLALVFVLALITFVGHPSLHVRSGADLSDEERAAARAEVARAIRRMDVLLRVDLVLAALTLLALAATATSRADSSAPGPPPGPPPARSSPVSPGVRGS